MLFLVTVVLAWGLTWPINKVILRSLPPLWAVALRTALAAAVLVLVASFRGRLVRPPRGDMPVLLSITLLHIVGFSVLSTWGLMRVPAGRSVVLAYTTPLWVIPGAWLFLGERLTPRRAAGVVIGLAGLVTLFNPLALDWTDGQIVLGHLAIVAAAMLWALSILHIRGHRWISTPFELLPWETMLATVILVPLAVLGAGSLHAEWTPRLVLLVLYAGIPGLGARLLGRGDGEPRSPGGHHLAGTPGDTGRERDRGDDIPRRAAHAEPHGGHRAHPRRRRARHRRGLTPSSSGP
jgi:drug/metabolite transporter (DMT)-like permease